MLRWALVFLAVFIPNGNLVSAPLQERNLESPRTLGKGGVFVGAYDSDDAVRLNPATLADPHKMDFQIRWLEADAFVGQNTISTLSDLLSTNFSSTAPVNLLQKFTDKFGQQQYGRIQLGAAMRILSFEISPYFRSSNWLDVRVPTLPEAWIYSSTAFGLNIAFAYDFGGLQVGTNIRPFSQTVFDKNLSFSDVLEFEPLGSRSLADEFKVATGSGIATDIGFIWQITKDSRLGLQIDDVGYTSYSLGATNDPKFIRQRVSLGYYSRGEGKPWHWDWGVDLQDILNPDDIGFLRMLKIGTEFGRSWFTRDLDIGVAAGLNEGYLSMGGFINLWLARLDIVNYGVELGESAGQRQDRRWAYTLRTSMDI